MGNKVALGSNSYALVEKPRNFELEQRVFMLEDMMKTVYQILGAMTRGNGHAEGAKKETKLLTDRNKDGIPVGIPLYGESARGGFEVLTVQADGYILSGTEYESLSAAAEATSGVRRSGWTFWRTPDGATVKEAFRD